jgi:L-ascorbate metabolism protein UlaG (beta-lactamase superfamily)
MRVRWYGHASFHLTSAVEGRSVFLDPFGVPTPEMEARGFRWGYPPIRAVTADLVLVTHDHFDHSGVERIAGSPTVVRVHAGVVDTPLGQVTGVNADHDSVAGSQRGVNVLYALTLEGLRVAHFGDYGQAALRPAQVKALGAIDMLMLPVGGGPTIDSARAVAVVHRLRPRYVVPMHYRTSAIGFLEPADAFLAAFERVVRLERPDFESAELPKASRRDPVVVVPAVPSA